MFSIALAVGATLGAVTVFVSVFVSLRATPAARPDLDSWTGAANVAAVAAIVGAIVGLIVAAASWSVAALVLVLVARRWRAPPSGSPRLPSAVRPVLPWCCGSSPPGPV